MEPGLLVSMLMSIFSNLSFFSILEYHEYAVQGQQLQTRVQKLTLYFDWNQAVSMPGLPAFTQTVKNAQSLSGSHFLYLNFSQCALKLLATFLCEHNSVVQ